MTLLTYLFEASICMAIFFCFYFLALQKQTTFQLNRWYLLVTLLLSCIIPLVKIYIQARPDNIVVAASPVIVGSYLDALEYAALATTERTPVDWIRVALAIYLTGVVVFFVQFLIEIKKLRNIILHAQQVTTLNHTFYLSPQVQSPFSFFEKTFFPTNHTFTEEEIEEVMTHEHAHMRGGHTWDILIVAVAGIFFWMNPVIYMYRRTLREVHEFLADAAVVKDTNWENYASFLISQKNYGLQNQLSHQLVYSQLKNRLIMMTKSPSSALSKFKYVGLIPLCLLTIILFSFRQKEDISNAGEKKVYNIYKDGLKVYTSLDSAVWQYQSVPVDTYPDVYITALRSSATSGDTLPASPVRLNVNLPRFPGCGHLAEGELGDCNQLKLYEYINKNLRYPAQMMKDGIEGKVMVKFTVGADGYIKDVAIQYPLHRDADMEVLRIFSNMNKDIGPWTPLIKEGKAIDSETFLPIMFKSGNIHADADKQIRKDVYTFADEMPRFPGCEHLSGNERSKCANEAMFNFIYSALKYPKEDREANREGVVIAQFIVEADGHISSPQIVRGASEGMNNEILRVMNEMIKLPQQWIPAKHEGKNVSIAMTVPFRFVLQSPESKAAEKPLPDIWGEKEINNVSSPVENDWIKIKPNPASDFVILQLLEDDIEIRISNITRDRIMWQQKDNASATELQIDVSNWPSGKYVIYTTKDGQLKMGGFIVMH